MIDLAGLLLGGAALLLHLALMLMAAPLAASFVAVGSGLGASGMSQWRRPSRAGVLEAPFQELGGLLAKEPIRAGNASPLRVGAPILALGLSLTAAALVPSFATGLLDSPFADLVLVLSLLAAAYVLPLLAAADDGLATAGLASLGGLVSGLLAMPGAILAVLALSLLSGGTGLDQMTAAAHSGAGVVAGCALAAAAMSCGGGRTGLSQSLSGPDLALFRILDGVQILVWVDLVGGLVLPGTLAAAQSGPLGWLAGLLFWAARLVVCCILLGLAFAKLDSLSARRRLAGLSLLLAALSPILFLAGRSGT